jgi:deoxyribose-phosphate aldolase
MRRSELAQYIDHTLLGSKASRVGVVTLCEEGMENGVASVCVDPCYAKAARQALSDSAVKLCVVIGFPHGLTTPQAKAFEAQEAIDHGAEELDMVVNVCALKEGDEEGVLADIGAVVSAAREAPRPVSVKVILETAALTEEEKRLGAKLAKDAGADYVKTSTGFGPGGATVEDVALLRAAVGPDMGVKAAGGIRDYETALAMIEAGATRIGASRTLAILDGAEA